MNRKLILLTVFLLLAGHLYNSSEYGMGSKDLICYALSTKITKLKKYSAAFRKAYKTYSENPQFRFIEVSSYNWCKENKKRYIPWFRDDNVKATAITKFPREYAQPACQSKDEVILKVVA